MRVLALIAIVAAFLLSGCKAVEGGYDANKAKQDAAIEKAAGD